MRASQDTRGLGPGCCSIDKSQYQGLDLGVGHRVDMSKIIDEMGRPFFLRALVDRGFPQVFL